MWALVAVAVAAAEVILYDFASTSPFHAISAFIAPFKPLFIFTDLLLDPSPFPWMVQVVKAVAKLRFITLQILHTLLNYLLSMVSMAFFSPLSF